MKTEDFIGLIPHQHRGKPKYIGSVMASLSALDSLGSASEEVQRMMDLDLAVGVWLDMIGRWVGVSRFVDVPIEGVFFSWNTFGLGWNEGVWRTPGEPSDYVVRLDDETYRTVIHSKIHSNKWDGTKESAYAAWGHILPNNRIEIHDNQDMSFRLVVFGSIDALTRALIGRGIIGLKCDVVTASVEFDSEQPTLSVNPTELELGPEGQSSSFEIDSNTSWSVSSDSSWCSVSQASGSGDATISVVLEENENEDGRTATISITSGHLMQTVSVSQSGAEIGQPALVPAPRIFPTIGNVAGIVGANPPAWLFDNVGGFGTDPGIYTSPIPLNAWVTFQLAVPLPRVLFQFMASGVRSYEIYGWSTPRSYEIEISSDGSSWSSAVVVGTDENVWGARAHLLEASSIGWIRFRITGGGQQVNEIDIHDMSYLGANDTWAFLGDSITNDWAWRRPAVMQGTPAAAVPVTPAFNVRVNQLNPARYPSMMSWGVDSTGTAGFLANNRLRNILDANSGIHFVGIQLGSNIEALNTYESNMRQILDMILGDGMQPIIARIPHSTASAHPDSVIQQENLIVDALTAEYGLVPGPDLWTLFYNAEQSGNSMLRDELHPNASGIIGIVEAWAQVAASLSL